MNRRRFLKSICATSAALAAGVGFAKESETARVETGDKHSLAAPCGLYCGICRDQINGECHGCGCKCGKCAGQAHAEGCTIAACARKKGLVSCGQCDDLPCTHLIQFTLSPEWRTHSPCIENLRRRKKVGTVRWLREQEAYWRDENNRRSWLRLYDECSQRSQELMNAEKKDSAH